jgi:hypothetical protein
MHQNFKIMRGWNMCGPDILFTHSRNHKGSKRGINYNGIGLDECLDLIGD